MNDVGMLDIEETGNDEYYNIIIFLVISSSDDQIHFHSFFPPKNLNNLFATLKHKCPITVRKFLIFFRLRFAGLLAPKLLQNKNLAYT